VAADGTFYACEKCKAKVDPDAPGIVRAFEQDDVTTFADDTTQYMDGLGVFFHERCYPTGSRRYRRAN
jgi:hypothetical protein